MPTELPGEGIAHFTVDFAETDEKDEDIDYEQDHTETHHLSGKVIRILYEYGWCTGVVAWYNAKMAKFACYLMMALMTTLHQKK